MLSLSLYHWTDKLSSRKLCNRAFHLPNAENSPITEKKHLYGEKKKKRKDFWGKTTCEMDRVKVKTTQRKNPLIIQAATTPSIRMIASCWAWLRGDRIFSETQQNMGKGGAGRVFWCEANKGTTISSIKRRPKQTASAWGVGEWKEITVSMPCCVFTPPPFWAAGAASLAPAFLFSSVLPTSVLTFTEGCGPGYWVPHQWRRRRADFPCVPPWHASLVTSCLCWCQLAASAGRPHRSVKLSLCHRHPLPNMHWGWVSPPHVPLPPASLRACARSTQRMLLQEIVSKRSTIATFWSVNAQQM